MDCILETRGLTKQFGRGENAQIAVNDVNLHVRRGRVYGLLVPQRRRQIHHAQDDRGHDHNPLKAKSSSMDAPGTREDLYEIRTAHRGGAALPQPDSA